MRSPSFLLAGVLVASVLSTPAQARSAGITGRSGKPLADGTPVQTCTMCHAVGAIVPIVEISGPTSVMAGTTNQYTFIMRGGPAVTGGVNLAVDRAEAALELVENSGLQKLSGELTHAAGAKPFSNGEVRFDFSMSAPGNGGVVTIYGAGNSVDGDKRTAGDGVATTKLEVTVQVTDGTDAGVEDPDSGMPLDAGTEVDAGTEADAGTVADAGTGTGDPDHDHDDEGGGCSSTGGAPMLMFVLGAVGLTLLRRRRA